MKNLEILLENHWFTLFFRVFHIIFNEIAQGLLLSLRALSVLRALSAGFAPCAAMRTRIFLRLERSSSQFSAVCLSSAGGYTVLCLIEAYRSLRSRSKLSARVLVISMIGTIQTGCWHFLEIQMHFIMGENYA